MSSDITFIINEAGKTLRERLAALLGTDTRQFDCLVGYFLPGGPHSSHPRPGKIAGGRVPLPP